MNQLKLITEIHNEFDTAETRLLDEANAILSNSVDFKETPIETIGERLKRVGFINVPTVQKAAEITTKKNVIKKHLVETREQAETIQYYQQSYPFLKFLTESELDRICKKYKLVYAPIDTYIKDVPEKNLRDIEIAQRLKSVDMKRNFSVVEITKFWSENEELEKWLKGKEIIYDGWVSGSEPTESELATTIKNMGYNGKFGKYIFKSATVTTVKKQGLFIAAPDSHFNFSGLTKKGLGFFNVLKVEIKDPIVFRYVRGGIQVITKWGLEANDPSLVVPVLN